MKKEEPTESSSFLFLSAAIILCTTELRQYTTHSKYSVITASTRRNEMIPSSHQENFIKDKQHDTGGGNVFQGAIFPSDLPPNSIAELSIGCVRICTQIL